MKHRIVFLLLAVFAACAASAAGAEVFTRKSTVRGVVVAVTAGNLDPEATVWDFAVVLRAGRGTKLGDDLLHNAVLVDPGGRQYKVLAWEEAAAAPRHRAGVLKFIAVAPRPESIELRIERPGETRARSFRWLLGSGLVAMR
jgi:hypothetical protein